MWRTLAIIVVAGLFAFAATTWWALEWSGVGTIHTSAGDGSERSTHVWYAEPNGELWIEAGTRRNPWFVDVGRDPNVTFGKAGEASRYVARPQPGAAAHDRIRSLLRSKYGFRDWWVGLLVDTSGSVAVRLEPAD